MRGAARDSRALDRGKACFPRLLKAYGASALRAPGHDGCFGVVAGREKVDEAPHPPQLRAVRRRQREPRSPSPHAAATSASTTASSSAQPITVGISLPLTGSFAADGQATENGYKLWASDVNSGRRAARPPGPAEDPERQQQRQAGDQPVHPADHAGPRGPDAGPVLHAADRRRPGAHGEVRLRAGGWLGHRRAGVREDGSAYFFSVSVPAANEMDPFAQLGAHAPAQRAADRRVPGGQRPVRRPARDGHRGPAVGARRQDRLPGQREQPGQHERDRSSCRRRRRWRPRHRRSWSSARWTCPAC